MRLKVLLNATGKQKNKKTKKNAVKFRMLVLTYNLAIYLQAYVQDRSNRNSK